MYTRHNEVPVFEYRYTSIDASIYNQARLAHQRLAAELRLSLPGLRHLDLIIQNDAWIIVDRGLNDIPVLAWSDFLRGPQHALHVPVRCQLRLFHANAGSVVQLALQQMRSILRERLGQGCEHRVVPFPKPQ